MLPSWQTTPVTGRYTAYNWDSLSVTNPTAINQAIESHKVVMSPPNGLPDMSNEQEVFDAEMYADFLRDYVPPEEDSSEPNSDINYPIVDNKLSSIRIVDNVEDSDRPSVVAMLVSLQSRHD
jgi:hypothetical protein